MTIGPVFTAVIRRPWYPLVELFFLFFIPLTMFMTIPDSYLFRWLFMGAAAAYVLVVTRSLPLTKVQLGFSRPMRRAVIRTCLFTVMAAGMLPMLKYLSPDMFTIPALTRQFVPVPFQMIMIGYALISVPLQEFLFRGYLTNRLAPVIKSEPWLILCVSLLFAIAHLPFGSRYFTLGTFVLGLAWEYSFLRHRNIYLIMMSHMILGGIYIFYVFH